MQAQEVRVQLMCKADHETSWWGIRRNPRETIESQVQAVHRQAEDQTKTSFRFCQYVLVDVVPARRRTCR